MSQPLGPLYTTGCRHGIRVLRDAKQIGFIVYHGENRESQRLFSDHDFARYGEAAERKKLIAWLHEIHEYEDSNAVVSHV